MQCTFILIPLTFAIDLYATDSLGLRLGVDVLSEHSSLFNKVWIQVSICQFLHLFHFLGVGWSLKHKA